MNEITSFHSVGAVVRNSLRMQPEHFQTSLAEPDAVKLFQSSVEMIEVETTSFCNRTCSFCPNSFIDRHSEKNSTPEEVWQAILVGLKQVNYSGNFVWSRYSEPLSEKRILDRIQDVHQAAPNCRVGINSNGDYLNADYLTALEAAGLNRLFIDVYIPDDETYSVEVGFKFLHKLSQRINRSHTVLGTTPEVYCQLESDKMVINAIVRNSASLKSIDMSDRGGLMENARKATRTSPCYSPFKHLVIDWDGSIVLCCQVRSDSPSHQDVVFGKIGVDGLGLVDAYVRLAEWRNSLKAFGPKQGPCASCNVSEYEATPITQTLSSLLTQTNSPVTVATKSLMKPYLKNRHHW